ncbi:MAG: porin family protein [Bacteroidetes bacterium]|nr:porin family protein [Bacteroidota bacterium]
MKSTVQKQLDHGLRKIYFLFLILLGSPFYTSAQRQGVMNLPRYDHQKIHFGFTLGMNLSDFNINLVPDFRIRDSVYSLESEPIAGLNLGILANLRIGESFDLRFIPSLSFAQRNLNYNFIYSDSLQGMAVKTIESNYLEFPVDLKFKSRRITNYRIYVLAGFKYSIDMISQASVDAKDKDIVKLKRYDYGYEIGLGFDFYMPYFKFSPEIKMYHGLNNMFQQDGKMYSRPIEALFSKVFVLSFMFE